MNKEALEAYGLAGIGFAEGLYQYVIKPELTAKRAWIGLTAGVLAYDLLCAETQTLSEAFRRQPLALQIGELALMSAHLLGIAPQYDPIHQAFKLIKGGQHGIPQS